MTVTLKGITWNHTRGFDPLAATAREYAAHHENVEIQWERRSLQAFADHPLDELASRYDLLVIDHPHVGFAARTGCLTPLDTWGRDAELTQLATESLGASHSSYAYDGHQWALSIDAAAQVSAYRADLISRIPQTWAETLELAKSGRVLWPLKPIDALSSFATLAANRGTPLAAKSDQLIEQDAAREVLEVMIALAQHVPSECLGMNPPETLDWMSREDNSRYAYCPLLYGYSNYARAGYRPRLVKFANLPALSENGPCGSQLGGTGLAVSSRSAALEIAVDYAFWVAGAECQRTLYFQAGGQPGNAVAWEDAAVNAAASDFFRDTRETLDRAWVRPRYDGWIAFQDRAGIIVNYCLSGKLAIEKAWEQLETAYRESRQ